MMRAVALLHERALPHTVNSRRGVRYLEFLYSLVGKVGTVLTIVKEGQVVGAISYIGPLILTLVVDPIWQRKGVGTELLKRVRRKCLVYTEESTAGFYEKQGFGQLIRIGKVILLWRS